VLKLTILKKVQENSPYTLFYLLHPGGCRASTSGQLGSGASQQVNLVSKATDASYNTQPDSVAGVWNLRGVVNNAWHRVGISVGARQ